MFFDQGFPMRKLALALSIVALGAPYASAADLPASYPRTAAPMIAPGWDWSGFYAGINAGYASDRGCWDNVNAAGVVTGRDGCHNATGALAGVQAGYRTQIYSWVLGVEAQGDWARLRGSSADNSFFLLAAGDAVNNTRIDAIGLFNGQVGFALDRVLFTLRGGAAVVSARYNDTFAATGIAGITATEVRVGGTAGAGLEFGIAPGLSLGVVYDHLFMGSKNVGFTSTNNVPAVNLATHRIRQDIDMVTFRVNYVFGGPSIAKY
jgi:outer membrane immunogenic protein